MKKGFSIVEFMVAISIGTLLIATVGSVYISNKKTFRIQLELSRMQENARVANYFLTKDIRMAGFQGCGGENFVKVINRVKDPTPMQVYSFPLLGYDGLATTFSPALPSNLTGKTAPGSDALEIRMATNTGVQLQDDMNRTNNPIQVYDRLGIQPGEILMISNCIFGDIFIAGSDTNASVITHSSNNNSSNDLSTPYATGAQVSRYVYYAYYIKDSGRKNTKNEPIYTLVRQDSAGNENEIVDGLEKLKITYGVDSNADKSPERFQTATEVAANNNWNKVISVRLNLLFATIDNVANQPQVYEFNGTTYTATDLKLRRELESYITLRNRGLPS